MLSKTVRSLMSVILPNCLRLPRSAPEPLKRGCRAMFLATVPLWGLGVVGCWRRWEWGSMGMVHDAATATLILGGTFWGMTWLHGGLVRELRTRNADMRALIRQNGDLCERIPKEDRPSLLRPAR